jgi:hypothetical protein
MENQNKIGIIYTKTGVRLRGKVVPYHSKPQTLLLNNTNYAVDIEMITPKKRKEVLNFFGVGHEEFAKSRFTIGFEIEKTSFSRGIVKEYELFCGFETDSSCGYEAVTHVLPLIPPSKWRMKVFDMMVKAKDILDSPCDIRCGGHINVGVEGLTGDEIIQHTRKYMGIFYALFRNRLNKTYCKYNPRMLSYDEYNSSSGSLDDFTYQYHSKYRVALNKTNIMELRLPSRVENVKQLMRRYELMYELVDTAFNHPKRTFKSFLKNIKPTLIRMYDNDMDKVERICKLAEHFQVYINTGKAHIDIAHFLVDINRENIIMDARQTIDRIIIENTL